MATKFLICVLSFFFIQNTWSETPNPDLYQQAILDLQNQKFTEASTQFRQVYESGRDFAALFYNWGLAEYNNHNLGLATALWRKALSLDPELVSAHNALDFVKNELPRQSLGDDLGLFARVEKFVSQNFSVNRILILNWILFVITSFLFITYFKKRKVAVELETAPPSIPVMGTNIAVLFVISMFLFFVKISSIYQNHGTIISKTVVMRTAPDEQSNSIFELFEGLEVNIKTVKDKWALITLNSGVSGWIQTENIFQTSGSRRLW